MNLYITYNRMYQGESERSNYTFVYIIFINDIWVTTVWLGWCQRCYACQIHSLCSGSLTELSMNISLTSSQQEICVILLLKLSIEPFVKSTWLRRKTKTKQRRVYSKASDKENFIMQRKFLLCMDQARIMGCWMMCPQQLCSVVISMWRST